MKKISKTKVINMLNSIDYAIFDFDGSVYPSLFLFDLANHIFLKRKKTARNGKNLKGLYNAAAEYKDGKFCNAYLTFANTLKGQDEILFQENATILMQNCYKYAKLTLKKLKYKYNIHIYMVSLTADFIAEIVNKQLGFDDSISIKYMTQKYGNKRKFNGKLITNLDSPQIMKRRMFLELKKKIPDHANKKFMFFFDSSDDIPIAKKAAFNIGINPSSNLEKVIKFDYALKGTPDPWKEFYDLIK